MWPMCQGTDRTVLEGSLARSVARDDFAVFFSNVQPKLQRALVAMYGWERGREATAEAFAWAWEHWGEIREMVNATGYLFRVGQSRTRPRRRAVVIAEPQEPTYWFEPRLGPALKLLSARQRAAVVLVHGFEWSMQEVAELIGCRKGTVQRHLERGLRKLRRALEVTDG